MKQRYLDIKNPKIITAEKMTLGDYYEKTKRIPALWDHTEDIGFFINETPPKLFINESPPDKGNWYDEKDFYSTHAGPILIFNAKPTQPFSFRWDAIYAIPMTLSQYRRRISSCVALWRHKYTDKTPGYFIKPALHSAIWRWEPADKVEQEYDTGMPEKRAKEAKRKAEALETHIRIARQNLEFLEAERVPETKTRPVGFNDLFMLLTGHFGTGPADQRIFDLCEDTIRHHASHTPLSSTEDVESFLKDIRYAGIRLKDLETFLHDWFQREHLL